MAEKKMSQWMLPPCRWLVSSALVLALSINLPVPVAAHDIPDEIVIQAFVKPEGERLHLLLRLPLILLLNLDLPKRGPGYLDLEHIDEGLEAAANAAAAEIALFENGRRLEHDVWSALISLPSSKSFSSYSQALDHVKGPRLPVDTSVFWNQGFFDAHLQFPIASHQGDFSLQVSVAPGLGDRLKTLVQFLPVEGLVRAYQLVGNTAPVVLDPGWHQAAWTFVKSGFNHILEGLDHLLFLLCLVIPFRRLRSLVVVVTSFTVAHSITLIAAAYGLVPAGQWFPPLVETLIAISVIYMAIENVVKANLARRWFVAFAFGLVHGFGFSFALRESIQFAGSHLLLSLLSFNVGVELGQILVIVLMIPALTFFFRYILTEQPGRVVLSVLVGHTAWHWMTERASQLGRYEISVPSPTTFALMAGGVVLLFLVSRTLWTVVERWVYSAHPVVHSKKDIPGVL